MKFDTEESADGKASVLADCSRSGGTYRTNDGNLSFSGIFLAKMARRPARAIHVFYAV